jgi:hypothetical protein
MRAQRKSFAFREDAIDWIRKAGFYYVEYFGWCHAEKFSAIVEPCGRAPRPWILTVYKNAVPNKPEITS